MSGDAILKMDDLSDGENEKSKRENENKKMVMKERERNYKKFLIEQGRSSATKWETFSEDEEEVIEESPDTSLPKKGIGRKRKFENTDDVSSGKKPKNKKKSDDFGHKIKEAVSEDEEDVIPQSLDTPISEKSRGKKRKIEKDDVILSEKKSKNRKKSEDSGQKMEKIKAKLKAKYDNDKWEKIPNEIPREKSQQRCLGCRELGHLLKDCKVFAKKARDICLKCGSSDHKHNVCPVYKGPRFDYATCFKCKQMVSPGILHSKNTCSKG